MSRELGRLDILLTADAAQYRREIRETTEETESNMGRMINSAKTLAAGMVAGFSIGAVTDWITTQTEAALAAENTAMAVGVSTSKMAGLTLAVNKMGLEGDIAKDALSGLNEKILAAGTEGGDAANMFTALGINVKSSTGELKSADVVMGEISDKFAVMADGSTKAALASELMGDAGADLIPVLNQGGAAIAASTAEAERMGLVLDKQTIASMRQLKADTAVTTSVLDGAKNQLIAGMMPALSAMSGGLRDVAGNQQAVSAVAKTMNFALKGVAMAVAVVGGVFEYAGDRIGKFAAIAGAIATGEFSQAWAIFNDKSGLQSMSEVMGKTFDRIQAIYDSTGAAATAAAVSVEKANAAIAASDKLTALSAKPEKEKKEKAKKPKAEKIKTGDAIEAGADYVDKTIYQPSLSDQFDAMGYMSDAELEQYEQRERLNQQSRDRLNEWRAQLVQDQMAADQNELDRARQQQAEKLALIEAGLLQQQLSEEQAAQLRQVAAYEYAQAETAERKRQWDNASGFFLSSLDKMAQGQGKAAKVAREINKARSIVEITQNTAAAAMAAYKSMVGIPVIGPGLAAAAAAAAVAFGAMQIRAVNADGAPSAQAPNAPAIPAAAPVPPASEQPRPEQRTTTVYIPENNVYTGRALLDALNQTLADGGKIHGSVSFVGT